jgi:tol-pal system protein YbgF
MAYRTLSLLAASALFAAAAGPAGAQSAGADRRMDRLEQSVRTLQATVLQAQATGQPVVVRPEGPDPVLTTMQQRVADLEQTLQRINGQLENLTFEIEQAKRAEAAAETDRRTTLQALNERVGRLDSQVAALTAAMAPPEPLAVGPNDARTAPDATGRAQAEATGALDDQVAQRPPPANPGEAFTQARALFAADDYEAAAAAFQDFVARYPTNTRAPEAYYWLGESFFLRRGYQTATGAYASALRTNPNTSWAPAAYARLAQSLANSNQNAQACAALATFDQRYAARASAAVKANAQTARTRARCG